MRRETTSTRLDGLVELGVNLRGAVVDLFSQEFSYSSGHLAAILNTCLFAPSLLTFWFVNGALSFDVSSAGSTVTIQVPAAEHAVGDGDGP